MSDEQNAKIFADQFIKQNGDAELARLRAELAAETARADDNLAELHTAETERDEALDTLGAEILVLRADLDASIARAERAEAALRPFAALADEVEHQWLDHETHWMDCIDFMHPPTIGDLRRARAVLAQIGGYDGDA